MLNKKITTALSIIAALVFWQVLAVLLKQNLLIASPIQVLEKVALMAIDAEVWRTVFFSFKRIVAGYFSALILGSLLAITSGRYSIFEIFLKPYMITIKTIPVASFIIISLIWISSSQLSIFISFLIVLPIVYSNILEGIKSTDKKMLQMAKVFNISFSKRFVYIYLSQLKPYIISACSISLGLAWKSGVAAEVIGIPNGSIGEMLYEAKIYLNSVELFSWTLIIIAVSIIFEKCFIWLLLKGFKSLEK